MMGVAVHAVLAGLALSDTPLAYHPGKGPKVPLTIAYSQREAYQPEVFHYSHLGPNWAYTGISYIVDDPQKPGHSVQRYMAGGGTRLFKDKGYDAATGVFAPDPKDMSVLKRVSDSPPRYERRLKGGSVDIYAHSDGKETFPRRIFLTEQRDLVGNVLKYQYDVKNRLVAIIDASGQKTTLEYKHPDPLKITALIDPAGRRAQVAYDGQGRLLSITDAVGIVSKVAYRGNTTFVERLETPYGVMRFDTGEDAHSRWVEVTDPLGHTARVESRWGEAPIAASEKAVPMGINLLNRDLNRGNTFYWDAAAYAQHKGDYTKARVTHWLVEDGQMVDIESSVKQPQESRVWYSYQGQTSATSPGSCERPTAVARVLPDGGTQLEQMTYNLQGQITRHVDPLGRETQYEYAANGTDLLKVRQKNGERYDTLKQITWNDQHRPLTIRHENGQTTQYAWNETGRLVGNSNALGAKRKYRYDARGRVVQISDAQDRVLARYTYDTAGNIASETDHGGRVLKHRYDALNRKTKTTYPDGTTFEITWDKLDIVQIKDRHGKHKWLEYDAVRNLISERNAQKTIQYSYDASGRLVSLTDGNGSRTKWERDLLGRIIAKTTADGAKTVYEYDDVGRLIKRTDALGQQRLFTYAKDNRMLDIVWRNALVATPDVHLAWDAHYPRMVSLTDDTGTTRYRYGRTGALGALKLIEEVGSGTNNVRRMDWDEIGRLKSWHLNQAGEDYTFDTLGRIVNRNGLLGRFDYDYLDADRTVRVALSGTPLEHAYAYKPNRGLKEIHHPPSARSYAYQKSSEHLIDQLTETVQGQSRAWQYEYDAIERLQSAKRGDGQTYRYAFDAGDNLFAITTPQSTKDYQHDAGNKVKSYRFDANGNRIEDGRHTYTWDAENRLVKIAYKNNPQKSTEFKYDGQSRRVAIIETDGARRAETRYLWCGNQICATQDAQGRFIAYYFSQGVYRLLEKGDKKEYYARDHLGSVRDVLDEKGNALARYDYDPYGNLTSNSEKKPEFGYAGMHYHAPSGLYLTKYRAYDPQSGRWLSRDPIEESGGINLYAYVGGNPVSWKDPLGLDACSPTGVGDTSVCSYYDEMASANPGCSYYGEAAGICKNEGFIGQAVNKAVKTCMDGFDFLAGRPTKTDEEKAVILEGIRNGLIEADKAKREAGQISPLNQCALGIHEYHKHVFEANGVDAGCYPGQYAPYPLSPVPPDNGDTFWDEKLEELKDYFKSLFG
jgi:RHS repeat-associated protein